MSHDFPSYLVASLPLFISVLDDRAVTVNMAALASCLLNGRERQAAFLPDHPQLQDGQGGGSSCGTQGWVCGQLAVVGVQVGGRGL